MKNKIINITILLLLVIFISIRLSIACEQLNKSESTGSDETATQTKTEVPSGFSGQFADSEGNIVHYSLLLSDGYFTEVYMMADSEQLTNEGVQEQFEGHLHLLNEEGELIKRFEIVDDELVLVEKTEQSKGVLPVGFTVVLNADFTSIMQHHKRLKSEGIVFKASGNEPFWNIQVNAYNTITYETPNQQLSSQLSAFDSESAEIRISFELENESAILEIAPENCLDSMSGFMFSHNVNLQIGSTNLTGCGSFL
ncbi:MAG: hypothetical protein EA391_08420 [Balneolaceae bacterium]|nr:MAG: hypothetical protein EA391_08420 [Balneolaceae bacterium]